ncbi:hypothetical protein MRX96_003685 [Rhipicephalus microplus]
MIADRHPAWRHLAATDGHDRSGSLRGRRLTERCAPISRQENSPRDSHHECLSLRFLRGESGTVEIREDMSVSVPCNKPMAPTHAPVTTDVWMRQRVPTRSWAKAPLSLVSSFTA